jgi:hypothetical protein
MHETIDPFISINPNELILENSYHETISITGNLYSSQYGGTVIINISKPDGTTQRFSAQHGSDGSFIGIFLIDKHWSTGEYFISASYRDKSVTESFTIQNNWETPIFEEFILVEGAMNMVSSQSSGFNILEFSGDVNNQNGIISILITKPDGTTQKFDTNLKFDGGFQFTAVLYDSVTKLPWNVGKYFVTAIFEEQDFVTTFFEIKNDNSIFIKKSTEGLFTIYNSDESENMSVESFHLEQRIITISGKVDNYEPRTLVTITIVNPDGTTESMSLYGTSDGEYFMPLSIDDTWYTGKYSIYSTYGESVNEVLTFEVTNGVEYISDEPVLEYVEITPILPILSYSIDQSSKESKLLLFETFVETIDGSNMIFPIIKHPDGTTNVLDVRVDAQKKIQVKLLINMNWNPGEYVLMLDENNPDSVFGNFIIIDSEKHSTIIPKKYSITQDYTHSNYIRILGDKIFENNNFYDYLELEGNVTDYTNGKIILTIPESEYIVSVFPNYYGDFSKQILFDKKLEKGFHSIVAKYNGKVVGTDEFLIAGQNTVSPTPGISDIHIGIDEIIDSGGTVSLSLNGVIPNFVMSDVKMAEIIMTSDDSTQIFSSEPIGIGIFQHHLRITDEFDVGKYDVICKYDGVEFGSVSVYVDQVNMDWIKDHTKRWLDGNISDAQYMEKLSVMKRGLIIDGDDITNNSLPSWFENTTQMWIDGNTSNDSFVDTIQYMVNNGIIW